MGEAKPRKKAGTYPPAGEAVLYGDRPRLEITLTPASTT
jgi:hypothetical protein